MPLSTLHFQSSSSPVSTVIAAIVVALIFLGIGLFFRKVKQDAAKLQVRIAQATPAEARVIQVGRSILQKEQGTVNVRLRLEISPKDRPRYQTTVTWDVENAALPKVQEGCRVGVKIDPENPNIIYPRVGWAEFNWVYSDTEKKGER